MKKGGLRRTSIYVILICVVLFAGNALLGFLLTNQSRDALITMIHNRMLDISNTAAAMIDGDMLKSLQAEDRDTPAYQAILKTLSHFQENIDLKFIYCVRDMGDRQFVFTIDPSQDPGEFGESVVYTDALYRASLGSPAVDDAPYEDRWGRFYSAYTPVFDSAGKVAGIVAVDFSAEWVDRQISRAFFTTLIIVVASLAFGTAIVILITSRARKRYRMIYKELNGVSDGIETLVREATAISKAKPAPTPETPREQSGDEINAIGDKLRSLQDTLHRQISFVRAQAYIDGLTGLENRTAYLEAIKALDGQISEGTAAFSVAVFDLNGLKKINDSFGHERGDQAIAEAGALLKAAFPDARLYRIGGDEFIALLKNTEDELKSLFARFDKSVADRNGDENIAPYKLAISKGFAAYTPGEDREFRSVFNRADDAMYADKAAYYMAQVNRLHAGVRQGAGSKGAMDVEYRQFATLFEYIENIKKRYAHPFELVMITLDAEGGKAQQPEALEKAMYNMEQSIQQTIRNVDVITRCSRQQFLIILLGSDEEGVQIAMERIFQGYRDMTDSAVFSPSYEVVQLQE